MDGEEHFTVWDNLNLLGGFAGEEWTSDQRIPNVYITVLSADTNGDDDISGSYGSTYALDGTSDNSSSVLILGTAGDPCENVRIDGFFITGGNNIYGSGGGILAEYASGILISNCVISGNHAYNGGGAAVAEGDVTFVNVIFEGNTVDHYGGGAYIETNTAYGNFMNTVFFGNHATEQGGGILWSGAGGTMNNSVFLSNYAGDIGQSVCSLAGSQVISNIISWGNSGGGSDITYGGPELEINNSLIETTGGYYGNENRDASYSDSSADPLFISYTNPEGDDGIWFTDDDGYLIQDGSTAQNMGKDPDFLDTYDVDGDLDTYESYPWDIFGQDRVDAVDAGVFEIQ